MTFRLASVLINGKYQLLQQDLEFLLHPKNLVFILTRKQ